MKWLALVPIRIYQGVHLAFFRNCCRFHPSCSEYAAQAVETHGVMRGILLGSWRLLRCQPFARGGWDPVPPRGEARSAFRFPLHPAFQDAPGFPAGPRRSLSGPFRVRRLRPRPLA